MAEQTSEERRAYRNAQVLKGLRPPKKEKAESKPKETFPEWEGSVSRPVAKKRKKRK